jgi:hypothetical protein
MNTRFPSSIPCAVWLTEAVVDTRVMVTDSSQSVVRRRHVSTGTRDRRTGGHVGSSQGQSHRVLNYADGGPVCPVAYVARAANNVDRDRAAGSFDVERRIILSVGGIVATEVNIC